MTCSCRPATSGAVCSGGRPQLALTAVWVISACGPRLWPVGACSDCFGLWAGRAMPEACERVISRMLFI